MMAYEQLEYQVTKKEEHIETRVYAPFVMMKTKNRSYGAFQTLFSYISGYNEKREKISMTVPVLSDVDEQDYLAFTMPKENVSKGYPKALDPSIEIIEVPQKIYLAIRFIGPHQKAKKYVEVLMDYAESNGIQFNPEPVLLRYQGPMVPPILRKHDVMLEVNI